MTYHLKRKESVGDGIRRIVRQEIGSALARFDDKGASLNESAHEIRKHCKKIRGALRLIRFSFPHYGNENARFRDLAQELSAIRDAYVMRATHRKLVKHVSSDALESSIAALDRALESHTDRVLENAAEGLESVRIGLNVADGHVDGWSIVGSEFEVVSGGLRDSYRRARNGLRRCRQAIDADHLHDWRKRVKYHWCHMCLLNNAWPGVIHARAVAAGRLSGVLGDDHDIEVYLAFLRGVDDKKAAGAAIAIQRFSDEQRRSLQNDSLTLGMRLFAEKPKRFVERVEVYWNAWRKQVR